MKDKFQSLDAAYKEQQNEPPNTGYDMNPNWAKEHPEWAAETAKTTKEYEDKSKKLRMDSLKKVVKPFKKGGTVSSASKRADGCCVKGKTRGKMM
jgi:hypothetical protein